MMPYQPPPVPANQHPESSCCCRLLTARRIESLSPAIHEEINRSTAVLEGSSACLLPTCTRTHISPD
ncbi:uncharacterized [Tachysurus ichikawai]